MKLYSQLEQLFKFRCNSNSGIIPYVKKLSEMGKFDEPKKVAVFAIILDRLGKMEDESLIQESLKTDTINEIATRTSTQPTTIAVDLGAGGGTNEPIGLDPIPNDGTNTDITGESATEDEKTVSEFTPDAITDPPQEQPTSTS